MAILSHPFSRSSPMLASEGWKMRPFQSLLSEFMVWIESDYELN